MADNKPAGKADEAPTNKAAKAPTNKAAGENIRMTAPDGRTYTTSDRAEAENLNRTRGYKFAK